MTPVNAAYSAPDGGTPCETAYNAYVAIDDAAKQMGGSVPWTKLPDQPTFLARCAKLPAQEQECLQPRYHARHHDVCDPITKNYDKKNPVLSD
jgi:hypothetical protein